MPILKISLLILLVLALVKLPLLPALPYFFVDLLVLAYNLLSAVDGNLATIVIRLCEFYPAIMDIRSVLCLLADFSLNFRVNVCSIKYRTRRGLKKYEAERKVGEEGGGWGRAQQIFIVSL